LKTVSRCPRNPRCASREGRIPWSVRCVGIATAWSASSLDAEAVDLLGIDPDEGAAESGAEIGAAFGDRFSPTPDLEHAGPPRIGRRQVVHDDGSPGIGLDIPVLLGRRHTKSADVDGAQLVVVPEGGGHDVGLSVGTGRGDPAQPLAGEVLDLRSSQLGHAAVNQAQRPFTPDFVAQPR
jgi:hypothetical protein